MLLAVSRRRRPRQRRAPSGRAVRAMQPAQHSTAERVQAAAQTKPRDLAPRPARPHTRAGDADEGDVRSGGMGCMVQGHGRDPRGMLVLASATMEAPGPDQDAGTGKDEEGRSHAHCTRTADGTPERGVRLLSWAVSRTRPQLAMSSRTARRWLRWIRSLPVLHSPP